MRASDVYPTRPPITSSPHFQNWFKGSKVVDKEGNPLVCYHGTFEDFVNFSYTPKNRISHGFNRLGFWFDADPRTPAWLAGYTPEGHYTTGSIYPCYLSIKKPFHLDSEYLFGDDYEEVRRLHDRVKEYSKVFYASRHDRFGNLVNQSDGELARLPDGTLCTSRMYQTVRDEYEAFVNKLGDGTHRIDAFWRLMKLLPGGIKSSTEDVVAFQKELIAEGHDGIYLGDTIADFSTRGHETTHWWIAFHPEQIKSVFAREFNPKSANISEANQGG